MNRKVSKLFVLPLLLSLAALTGCSGNSDSASTKKTLAEVTNFTFNFDSGEYGFTGSENATFYSLKVYQYVDGTLDAHAVASSGMIKATDENTEYSGTMDYTFTAGSYRAVIKAIAPRYKASEATLEGECNSLVAPTVTATWSTDGETAINITITAGDEITKDYTVSVTNTTSSTQVYSNSSVTAGSLTLTASDLTGVESLSSDDSYSVTVQGNAYGDYTAASAVTVSVSKADQGGGGGGFPGGDQGGGGGGGSASGFTLACDFTFENTATEISFTISGGTITVTGTKAEMDGASYYFTLADGSAVTGTLTLTPDQVATITADGGPYSSASSTGTWSETGTTVSVTVAA